MTEEGTRAWPIASGQIELVAEINQSDLADLFGGLFIRSTSLAL
jgi:hypothetical protein